MDIKSRIRASLATSSSQIKLTYIRTRKQDTLKLLCTGAILCLGLAHTNSLNASSEISNFESQRNIFIHSSFFISIIALPVYYAKKFTRKAYIIHSKLNDFLKFILTTADDTSITFTGTLLTSILIRHGNPELIIYSYVYLYFSEAFYSIVNSVED